MHRSSCLWVYICVYTLCFTPSERKVMTWVQYCVIEIDDLFYYLCFVCMCMCAYAPRVLRQHIVTLVVFGHQRPRWQRLKWWLRTGGLDGKMWINEAQIELIAMTSHNSGAAKWEYVVGPQESQRLFLLSRWWWEWRRQSCTALTLLPLSPQPKEEKTCFSQEENCKPRSASQCQPFIYEVCCGS